VSVLSSYDIFIGIDPGLDGAVAILGPVSSSVEVWRTPTIKVGTRRQYLVREMAAIVHRAGAESSAILEAVHSMPGQGVASSFTFGRGFGVWEGILAALGIPYQLVAPQTWKAVMLRDMPKDKNASKLLASRLWPNLYTLEEARKPKMSDGEAEALLLAEYGRRLRLG